jgi:hypothetical protein
MALMLMAGAGEAAQVPSPAPSRIVVLLPFENLSGNEQARARVAAVVARALEAKGYAVAQGEPVEAALEAERVRHLDSLPAALRQKLCAAFHAVGIVSGAVYTYASEGESPLLALSARLTAPDGAGLGWSVLGLSAKDTEGMLGLGRSSSLEALLREAGGRLQRDLPGPDGPPAPPRIPGKPFHLSGPRTARAPGSDDAPVGRLCLLPLENFTADAAGASVVTRLLPERLRQAGFDVVEPADLRAALVSVGMKSLRGVDADQLKKLGSQFGTSVFVTGSLYTYRDASPRGGAPPEVSLELSMVDAERGRVLWSSQHSRKGQDYASFLQRGSVSNAVTLADRVLAEMLGAPARKPAGRAGVRASREP